MAAWRARHEGVDLDAWRTDNGLAPRRFEVLAEREAACDWAIDNVDGLVPGTPASLDPESRFVLAWADGNGVATARAPSGSAELAVWVIERGPRFFGYPWEDEPEIWELLQFEGRAAELARRFFAEVNAS